MTTFLLCLLAVSQPLSVTRADLAAAYLRFEQALETHPPEATEVRSLSQAFDQATLAFFSGRNASAIGAIDAQSKRLLKASESTASLWCYKVRVNPPIVVADQNFKVSLNISQLYGAVADKLFEVALRNEKGEKQVGIGTIRIGLGPFASLSIDGISLPLGRYEVFVTSEGASIVAGHISSVKEMPSAAKSRHLVAIDALPEKADATLVSMVKSRLDLLVDEPSEANSAEFLANPIDLARTIEREVVAISRGENPYRSRGQDFWFRLASANAFPVRVYCPYKDVQNWPVIIALHGMGGDENMFMDGYGAGLIRRLASERGFVLASPRTESFSGSDKNVETLLRFLDDSYGIDRSRVYLLGHSMGAGAAMSIASRSPESFAGVVAIAGGRAVSSDVKVPPTLLIGGEVDFLATPTQMSRTLDAMKSNGQNVELRILQGYGHTMVVQAVLPDAVGWLLSRRKGLPGLVQNSNQHGQTKAQAR